MRPRRFLLTCALLIASIAPARAAKFERVDIPGLPGGGVVMTGVIAKGDEVTFHALVADMQGALIITTGPGGSVYAAMAIGSEIRQRGWATLVPPNAYCASACSMIWLSGARRLIADTGKIGFHAISIHGATAMVETHEYDFELHNWLNWLGYTEDTTATIVNTPSRLIRWLDRLELQANGIEVEAYP